MSEQPKCECGHDQSSHNVFYNAVENARVDGVTPRPALIFCMLLARGGKASREDLINDSLAWQREYGEPTWDGLRLWANTQDIESDIVDGVLQRNKRKLENDNC